MSRGRPGSTGTLYPEPLRRAACPGFPNLVACMTAQSQNAHRQRVAQALLPVRFCKLNVHSQLIRNRKMRTGSG
jgi:hypothetical protein